MLPTPKEIPLLGAQNHGRVPMEEGMCPNQKGAGLLRGSLPAVGADAAAESKRSARKNARGASAGCAVKCALVVGQASTSKVGVMSALENRGSWKTVPMPKA